MFFFPFADKLLKVNTKVLGVALASSSSKRFIADLMLFGLGKHLRSAVDFQECRRELEGVKDTKYRKRENGEKVNSQRFDKE